MRRVIASAVLVGAVAACPARAEPDGFARAFVSAVWAEDSALLDDEDFDSSALIAGLSGGWEYSKSKTRLQLSSTVVDYTDGGRDDRWNNELRLGQELELSDDVDFDGQLVLATEVQTLEFRNADQATLQGRLTWRPSAADRLRLYAAYRTRSYDDAAATNADAPYFGVEWRRRVDRGAYFELEARHEEVDADRASFDYRRTSLTASYSRTFDDKTRGRAVLGYRTWTYDNRLTPAGRSREDWSLAPELELRRALTAAVDLELNVRHVIRRSNDDRFERDGNRVAVSLAYEF